MTAFTVLIIAGPTASGKSGLALAVAEKANGVVINADSMQVYRGLPLLTAQPSAEDQKKIPHALYAARDPGDVCSAAAWRALALAEIEKALGQGRLPVIVGGTGFYLKALLEGLSPVPAVPQAFREQAAALQKKMGNPAFHAALQKRDPDTAAKLDPLNTQRVVRAWEVLEGTGKGLAAWQAAPPEPPPAHLKFITAVLRPPREDIYRRCDGRFDAMLKAGALAEAGGFLQKVNMGEIPASAPLAKALGYPELAAHLAGKISLEEAAGLAKQSTRHYARRQMTWFRNQLDPGIVLDAPDAAKLLAHLGV